MKKLFGLRAIITMIMMTGFLLGSASIATAADDMVIKELKKLIEMQQQQIDELKETVDKLVKTGMAPEAAPAGVVKSGNKTASVQLYGQVNRGVLVTDDGNNTDVYNVDNDNSSTRFGLNGKVEVSDDLAIGTKIEVQFESNSTADVNQNNKRNASDDHFTQRHLDFWIESETLGKLSIGQGDTASNGTAEVDLSGTDLIGYSSVSDMAGGILFYDNTTQSLLGTNVGSAFSNMDGMSRDDRVRYDTPDFSGFYASTSFIADDAIDVAIRYSDKFPGFKLAGALAYAWPENAKNFDGQVSGSLSLLLNCGFSATFAAGGREYDTAGRADSNYYYGKLGYQWKPFSIGLTAISIDYGNFNDIALNDDDGDTFGIQFVQKVSDWSTEFYMGYRLYELESTGTNYEDINALLTGARFKF
ncbi:MAG: porin [Desulfobacterales bacterium]|nr:porin [Desulfobacterales bacterium]